MFFEKTVIILTGEVKGTAKIERNADGLWADLSLYGEVKDCKMLVRYGAKDYIYGVKFSQNKARFLIDSEIEPKNADFCLFFGEKAVAVGTNKREKTPLWAFNLPQKESETLPQIDEKPTEIAEDTVYEQAVLSSEDLIFSTPETPVDFPPVSIYNDDAIAEENYYGDFMDELEVERAVESEIAKTAGNDDINDQKPTTTTTAKNSLRDRAVKVNEETAPASCDDEVVTAHGRPLTYYEKVSDEIDEVFRNGERVENLEKALPFTRWVKVDFDESESYVVGLIGEKPDYICYGLPGRYAPIAPQEIERYCQWLPLDVKDPQGEGYWLIYQSASTGKTIKFDDENPRN